MGADAEWVSKAFERDVATGIIIVAAVILVSMFGVVTYAIRAVWRFSQSYLNRFLAQNGRLIDAIVKTGKDLTDSATRVEATNKTVEAKLAEIQNGLKEVHDSVRDTRRDVKGLVVKGNGKKHVEPDSGEVDVG